MVSSRADSDSDQSVTSVGGEERVSRTVIKPRTGFRAELPGLDMATLLQMTCARRERLVVRVASHDDEGFIYSAEGRIVHATLGALVGEEAVLGMLAWTGGEFAIVDRPFPLHPSIECSTETLLLRAAQRLDEAARVSGLPPAPVLDALPEEASASTRAGAPPAAASVSPPAAGRVSIPPPAPRAVTAADAARRSIPPPLPGRSSSAPPSPMPPSTYANASPVGAVTRASLVPSGSATGSLAPGAALRVEGVPLRAGAEAARAATGATPAARGTIETALGESYDEEDDVPTLLPPSPRESAPSPAPRREDVGVREYGEAAGSDAARRSQVPPPIPPAARKASIPGLRAEEPRASTRGESVSDSALIASVRVDARGEVVGTFAGDGTGDLLPQLVAYVARLIALLRTDFSLDPFEALHAELSGMRIMLFEDAGEMVGLMMRPGTAVQELRQRLGV